MNDKDNPGARAWNSGTAKQRNLRRLLAPRHVAFVGGRNNLPAIEMLRAAGFEGEIWPVHPSHSELAGLPVFASVADLPEGPDAAFLNVPSRMTANVVRDLAALGSGGAVCYSAGYAELGEQGRIAQEDLSEAAGDFALVGPNANGILNNLDSLALWPARSHQPTRMESGVAIVSSSGGILFNYAINQRSVRAAILVATGNQAVLTFADYIEHLLGDTRITAIGLFTEDIGDPVRFAGVLARANVRQIPIVALKTGKSTKSAELAATHSGAMVAPDDMIDALFERTGVIRVRSLPEFDETLKMLTVPRPPRGKKFALLTVNGGEKALTLDMAAGMRMDFAPPSPATVAELARQIPEFASVSNPFDFNPHYSGENVLAMDNEASLGRCFETFLDDGYDIAMLLVAIRANEDGSPQQRADLFTPTINAFSRICAKLDVTGVVAATMPEHLPFKQRATLIDCGIAPLMGLGEALSAIDHAIMWQAWKARNRDTERAMPPDPAPPAGAAMLDEAAAKAALAAHGLRVPPSRSVATPHEAVSAANEIGFPVVLKVLQPVFAHKMSRGAVALHLKDAQDVLSAAHSMQARFEADGHPIRSMLVERMIVDATLEIILGIKYEPRFGHALLLGRGGIHAEELAAPEVVLLPAADTVLAHFIRTAKVLRSQSDATRDAVLEAAKAVARYCAQHSSRLVGLDVNPLIVDRAGQVTAVDALIQQSEES